MSSRRSDAALHLKRRRSRQLAILLTGMHAIGLFMLWPLSERFGLYVLPAVPLLLLSLIQVLSRHVVLKGGYAVTEITVTTNNEYLLGMADARQLTAVLRKGSYVHPRLLVLNFRLEQWPWYLSVPLLSDSADKDILRRLRVRLKGLRDSELGKLA